MIENIHQNPMIGAFVLILNYLALIFFFLSRYKRPKEWTEWIIESSGNYFVMFLLVAMIFTLPIFMVFMPCLTPFLFILIVLSTLALLGQIWRSSKQSFLPAFVYLVAVILEIIFAATTFPPFTYFFLAGWYFLGMALIPFGGKFVGVFLRAKNKDIENEHISLMKKIYGPEAPEKIKFKSGASAVDVLPSDFVGIGMMYGIWMIIRIVILLYYF